MNSQPYFSVIIPTYNRKPFLKKAIDTVLDQSFKDFELIVYDDGSTDGTQELLNEYADPRLIPLAGPNRGVSYARNRALERSTGKYIAFLDSDDWWTDNKLEITANYIEKHPEISIFHSEEVWYRNGKLLKQLPKHRKPDGWVYEKALPLCCISISTAVIKKSILDEIGHFDEGLEACEDYDLWLRATSQYEVKLIPEELTLKEGGRPDQLSSKIWGLDRFRIKAIEKILSSGTLNKDQYKATIAELKNKCVVFAKGSEKRGKPDVAAHYRAIPGKYL